MKKFLQLLFSFKGRINRKTYWIYFLVIICIISVFAEYIEPQINEAAQKIYQSEHPLKYGFITMFIVIICLAYFSTLTAVPIIIKRLHDINKSAWYLLLILIPIIDIFLWVILGCIKGDSEPNKYGNPPIISRFALHRIIKSRVERTIFWILYILGTVFILAFPVRYIQIMERYIFWYIFIGGMFVWYFILIFIFWGISEIRKK